MMLETAVVDWRQENQRHLADAIRSVRHSLERFVRNQEVPAGETGPPAEPVLHENDWRVAELVEAFNLTPFERDVVLLCAGIELDPILTNLVQRLRPAGRHDAVTFSLALAALPGAHWSALSPSGPLRYWRLVDLPTEPSLTLAPMRIDERILHFLTGVECMDERLAGLITPCIAEGDLPPSHAALAHKITTAWTAEDLALPLLTLCGSDAAAKQAIAASAAEAAGLELWTLQSKNIPQSIHEAAEFRRRWARESILGMRALLVEFEDAAAVPTETRTATSFVELMEGPVIASSPNRESWSRPSVTLDVERLKPAECHQLWLEALGPLAEGADASVHRLVYQFALDVQAIRSIGSEARRSGAPLSEAELWKACRLSARPHIDSGVQRIESRAGWNQLVLPPRQTQLLHQMIEHVQRRAEVYGQWGFGDDGERGLGIAALFAGQSGTGKTLAAEVLAGELKLDLYRIDLSSIVNKYVGETEKNLRRVFDAAEAGGAILLFDEADALFGKRGEVKDSHDRYANIEVSYLLQRMEAYRGLAILTTNLKENLDQAFLRRLRFIVQFPFPDADLRAELWRRAFPERTPTMGVDVQKLSKLHATGAEIRNIALHAAFLAAAEPAPVSMKHLKQAALVEFTKADKGLAESETRGWE